MPFIEQKDLVNLYNEVETLSKKEEELRKGFINLKLENNKLLKNKRYLRSFVLVLSIIGLTLSFLLFQSKKNTYNSVVLKKTKTIKEEIKKSTDDSKENNRDLDELIFTIQIGAFKRLDLDSYSKEELENFKKLPNKDLHTYSIGKFKTIKGAEIFLKEIKRMGVKDAFIVSFYKEKRINIKKALELVKNK